MSTDCSAKRTLADGLKSLKQGVSLIGEAGHLAKTIVRFQH